jgi:hypothetical protein
VCTYPQYGHWAWVDIKMVKIKGLRVSEVGMMKLNFYGITDKANEWIKSYLKNRYQRVEIKNKNSSPNAFSNWGIIKHGVPQGSILGPSLFLLYINDLSKTINKKSKPILIADDTSKIFKNSKFEDFKNDINIVFESLNKWFEANKLSLNFYKTAGKLIRKSVMPTN